MRDGEQLIEQRTDTDPNEYDDIVFVTAEQDDRFIRGLTSYGGPGAFNINGPDTIVVSVEHPYSTWAHEFGHAFYRWGDYYGGDGASGEIGSFGLMGSSRLDTHAATVMPYHRLDQGWANQTRIPAVSDQRPNSSEHLTWLSEGGDVAKFDPETDDFGGGNGVYQYILIGARDSSASPVPEHGSPLTSEYQDADQYGSGANVYLVTEPSVFGVVRSEPKIDRVESPSGIDPKESVTLRPGANDTIKDPDLGFNITAKPAEDGVNVQVQHDEPTNISGINLYTLIECENRDTTSSTECQQLTGAPREGTSALVAARFVGPSGSIGRYPNGTGIRTLENGTYLKAGSVQKLYVPRDSAAELNVSIAESPENISVSLQTQVVTRDADGDRIASGMRSVNVTNNSTYEPELARLNTSQQRWKAGSFRTLEENRTVIEVENNGIRSLQNVTVTTDSPWLSVNRSNLGTVSDASTVPIDVTAHVPAGAPVGNYTFNITIRGTGTAETQTHRVPVTITVLPTARWDATLENTSETFADTNSTTVVYTISNDASSNVPLRDVRTTATGNITALTIDYPETVSALDPGHTRQLTLTVQVPENGTEAGIYAGDITVSPLRNYTQHFVYPVAIPAGYDTLSVADRQASIRVDARGPATTANATFHPKRQVAMRKGSATERITVDAVNTTYDVPAESIRVRTSIPAGWEFQNWSKVWIVEEGPRDAPGGSSGRRTKLAPNDYRVVKTNGSVVLVIEDVRDTRFGQYMTDAHQLEAELKLSKENRPVDHDYDAAVDVIASSPIDIYETSSKRAAIERFYPSRTAPTTEPGYSTPPAPADRVAAGNIRISSAGRGVNATLSAPQRFVVDRQGSQQVWFKYELQSTDTKQVKNLWIRPATLINATHRVTDEGYIAVEALVTRNMQGSVASGLENGRRTTIELPATASVANRSRVRIRNISYSLSKGELTVQLRTPSGAPAARLHEQFLSTDSHSGRAVRNVTVGRGIFDRTQDRRSD